MELALLAVTALRSIGVVLNNPLLGGGSTVKFDEASNLMVILADLIEQGDDGLDDLRRFAATVEAMATEGRGPTLQEFAFLRDRSDVAHANLQAKKAEILAELEGGETSEPEEPETPQPTPAPETPPSAGPGEGVAVPTTEE